MKECDILGGSKHTLTLLRIFMGRSGLPTPTPMIYALSAPVGLQ